MILLDTHILLWWQETPEELPPHYRSILDTTSDELAISAITCWEISLLVKKGRLELPLPYSQWIRIATQDITILPLSLEVIDQVYDLPEEFHSDPADRIIAATAIFNKAKLATSDGKMIEYKFLDIL
jgi:PIN domain nuclease of toxin-antitoxin system